MAIHLSQRQTAVRTEGNEAHRNGRQGVARELRQRESKRPLRQFVEDQIPPIGGSQGDREEELGRENDTIGQGLPARPEVAGVAAAGLGTDLALDQQRVGVKHAKSNIGEAAQGLLAEPLRGQLTLHDHRLNLGIERQPRLPHIGRGKNHINGGPQTQRLLSGTVQVVGELSVPTRQGFALHHATNGRGGDACQKADDRHHHQQLEEGKGSKPLAWGQWYPATGGSLELHVRWGRRGRGSGIPLTSSCKCCRDCSGDPGRR